MHAIWLWLVKTYCNSTPFYFAWPCSLCCMYFLILSKFGRFSVVSWIISMKGNENPYIDKYKRKSNTLGWCLVCLSHICQRITYLLIFSFQRYTTIYCSIETKQKEKKSRICLRKNKELSFWIDKPLLNWMTTTNDNNWKITATTTTKKSGFSLQTCIHITSHIWVSFIPNENRLHYLNLRKKT